MRESDGQQHYRKSETNENKRIKLEERSKDEEKEENEEENKGPSLLSLSDDVLLMILNRLGPQDLLSLSLCCRRLEEVTKDRTLWETVDFRPQVLSLINLKKYIRFFQPTTKFIATCGPAYLKNQRYYPSMSKSFLRGVARNAPNLTTLILENHIIDSTKLLLEDFPRSLLDLRLRKCILNNVSQDRSYFHKIDKSLPKLKILDLSDSEWFVPHSLLALSKSQSLEALNLTGCDVSDCLPYASLAANFGFSSLTVLDLRFTLVSDIEVSCFNRTTTLRRLFLDAPSISDRDAASPDVTDTSITSFGGGVSDGHNNWNLSEGVVIIEVGAYPRPVCKLETLVVRGYPGITDSTLNHVAANMKNMKFIDVTGSGCSSEGIARFKSNRPEVNIVAGSQIEVT